MNCIKTGFMGSVKLSMVALQTIVEFGINVDIVFSLDESVSENVSDYYPIHKYAEQKNIDYVKFIKVGDVVEDMKREKLDYLFVIGISQLIPSNIIKLIKRFCIGFHPTSLPRYRGRAPIPWMILLGETNPMITIFKLDSGVDSGDIIFQEPYVIEKHDYANDVYGKVEEALRKGLSKSLSDIYKKNTMFVKQEKEIATYLLKRIPSDGEIKWSEMDGQEIYTLIRAVSYPYPGAYTIYGGIVVKIDRASLVPNKRYFGKSGQIAKLENDLIYVLTRDDKLLIIEKKTIESKERINFSVGGRFY